MCSVIFPYHFWVSVSTVLKSGCQGTTWIEWVGSGAALLMSFTGSVPPVAPSWSGEEAEEDKDSGRECGGGEGEWSFQQQAWALRHLRASLCLAYLLFWGIFFWQLIVELEQTSFFCFFSKKKKSIIVGNIHLHAIYVKYIEVMFLVFVSV